MQSSTNNLKPEDMLWPTVYMSLIYKNRPITVPWGKHN